MTPHREPTSEPITRRSPVEPELAGCGARWVTVGETRLGVGLGVDTEGTTVTLCDVSPLGMVGVKGPHASTWLARRGLAVPDAVYGTASMPDEGVVGRLGAEEFMVGGGTDATVVPSIVRDLNATEKPPYALEREDASFFLAGDNGVAVLAQTCGVDFRTAEEGVLVLTRVAGVSCTVLPCRRPDRATWRLWCDPTYAPYLWDQLTTIVKDLAGHLVGAEHCIKALASEEDTP